MATVRILPLTVFASVLLGGCKRPSEEPSIQREQVSTAASGTTGDTARPAVDTGTPTEPALSYADADAVLRDAPDALANMEHGLGLAIAIGDVTADGEANLVLATGVAVWVFDAHSLSGDMTTKNARFQLTDIGGSFLQLLDLDMDGHLDVVTYIGNTSTSNQLRVVFGPITQDAQPFSTFLVPGNGPVRPNLQDVDGDGDLDIVHCDLNDLQIIQGPIHAEHDGAITVVPIDAPQLRDIERMARGADFSGDGADDLLLQESLRTYAVDLPFEVDGAPRRAHEIEGDPIVDPAPVADLGGQTQGLSVVRMSDYTGEPTVQLMDADAVRNSGGTRAEFWWQGTTWPFTSPDYADVTGDGVSDITFAFGQVEELGVQTLVGPFDGYYDVGDPELERALLLPNGAYRPRYMKVGQLDDGPDQDLVVKGIAEVFVFFDPFVAP